MPVMSVRLSARELLAFQEFAQINHIGGVSSVIRKLASERLWQIEADPAGTDSARLQQLQIQYQTEILAMLRLLLLSQDKQLLVRAQEIARNLYKESGKAQTQRGGVGE